MQDLKENQLQIRQEFRIGYLLASVQQYSKERKRNLVMLWATLLKGMINKLSPVELLWHRTGLVELHF